MSVSNFMLVLQQWELITQGLAYTLLLLVVSIVIGAPLSIALAQARVHRVPILDPTVRAYVYIFRGTPLLVQLQLVYFGLAQFEALRESFLWSVLEDRMFCALLVFVLNTAAYMTEIFRGAIEAVPRGELEAADACGMSRWMRTKRVLLPNAFRRALPAFSNEVIFVLHGTAIVGVVAINTILGAAKRIGEQYYVSYESYVSAALLYGLLVFGITRAFRVVERRWGAGLQGAG